MIALIVDNDRAAGDGDTGDLARRDQGGKLRQLAGNKRSVIGNGNRRYIGTRRKERRGLEGTDTCHGDAVSRGNGIQRIDIGRVLLVGQRQSRRRRVHQGDAEQTRCLCQGFQRVQIGGDIGRGVRDQERPGIAGVQRVERQRRRDGRRRGRSRILPSVSVYWAVSPL